MKVFEIILTMEDEHKRALTLHKSDVAHIYLGPQTSFVKYKNNLSDAEIKTVLSIIKLGIVDYANANSKVKRCTIINRHTAQIETYDFNTIVDDEQPNIIKNNGYIYDYIIDASIEYNFNKVKTIHGHLWLTKLEAVLNAIIARLDIVYYKHYNFDPFFTKDDLLMLDDIAGPIVNYDRYATVLVYIRHLLTYFIDVYTPYYSDLDSAYQVLKAMYM